MNHHCICPASFWPSVTVRESKEIKDNVTMIDGVCACLCENALLFRPVYLH